VVLVLVLPPGSIIPGVSRGLVDEPGIRSTSLATDAEAGPFSLAGGGTAPREKMVVSRYGCERRVRS
jgi:hypothetical protein